MARLALLGCASIALALAAGGCVAYRPDPLDADAVLHSLRGRAIEEAIVERAPVAPGAAPRLMTFDPSDGLDEAEVVAVAWRGTMICRPHGR